MRLVIIREPECQATAEVSFAIGVTIPPAASNFLGKVTTIAKERLPARHVSVGYDFACDGGKPGSGGYGTKVP
jgi:hypothetical protein